MAAILAVTAAAGSLAAKAETLEDLQWMEHQLLLERDQILDDVNDPNLVFVEGGDGRLVIFERSELASLAENLAFIAGNAEFESYVPYLGAEIGVLLDTIRTLGLWNDRYVAAAVVDQLAIRSEPLRDRLRRRVREGYEPRIQRVRDQAQALLDAREGAGSEAGDGDLEGAWKGCDGRVVTFEGDGGSYVGRYTELGGLGSFGFSLGDAGYRAQRTGPAAYKGEVLWRWTDGRSEWRENQITVTDGTYADTASDSCSRSMSRVAE